VDFYNQLNPSLAGMNYSMLGALELELISETAYTHHNHSSLSEPKLLSAVTGGSSPPRLFIFDENVSFLKDRFLIAARNRVVIDS
jgi:hypothetical protein